MVGKNLGVRCVHYIEVDKKSLRREDLNDQDKLCFICRGVDSQYCRLYHSLYDLKAFTDLFNGENKIIYLK